MDKKTKSNQQRTQKRASNLTGSLVTLVRSSNTVAATTSLKQRMERANSQALSTNSVQRSFLVPKEVAAAAATSSRREHQTSRTMAHSMRTRLNSAVTAFTQQASQRNAMKVIEKKLQQKNNEVKSSRVKNEEAILDLRQRIPDVENIFDVHSRIGNGTFSTVLLATLKKDRDLPDNVRRKFAIKHHIPTSHPDRIIKELKCMVEMGGVDNVVSVNCTIRHNESVAFIMPYMPHDRFHDFYTTMDLAEVQLYMKNLLIALRRVHQFNIIHRDVKPSNFLYNRRKGTFLLVDFGLAQQVPTPVHQQQQALMSGHTVGNSEHGQGATTICESLKRLRTDASDGSPVQRAAAGEEGDTVVQPSKRMRMLAHAHEQNGHSSSNTFKMPLKQINEISTPTMKKDGCATGESNNCEQAMERKQKASDSNALETPASSTQSMVPQADAHAASRYNTNRNLTQSNVPKCLCYGHPQVCKICLVKKEVHASRAGTPGYRPPEVLLKYPDQTTAVDMWAAGVIFLSILSHVYPFFKAPNDFVALAEMVTIFGDRSIRRCAHSLHRSVTLSRRNKPLDLRKLCLRFRNRHLYNTEELIKRYQGADGHCEMCKNCQQLYFNCVCQDTMYAHTEPLPANDPFPESAYDLLNRLLEVNPHRRITAEEALKHPFFSEVCKEQQGSIVAKSNRKSN